MIGIFADLLRIKIRFMLVANAVERLLMGLLANAGFMVEDLQPQTALSEAVPKCPANLLSEKPRHLRAVKQRV